MSRHNVDFNSTALDIVNTLANINTQIAFEVENDEVVIKSSDVMKSIAYIFRAPKEVFNFDGDECSFYDFKEFHSLLRIFDGASLEQDDKNLFIKKDRQKITYRLTDREMIPVSFNSIKTQDPDVKFELCSSNIKRIKDLLGSVNAETIRFDFAGNELKYTLYNSKHPVKYEDVLEVENLTGEEFTIEINSNVFLKIPLAAYSIEAMEFGLLKFTMKRDDEIVVELFTADNED